MSSCLFRAGRLAGAIVAFSASAALVQPASAADTLSMKVGKPLQQAQTALAAHNYAKAMSAVDAAAAVPGKSEYEDYTITQMRAAVAAQSGNVAAATAAYDKLIASGRTPKDAKLQMMMAEATMAYTAKDYPRAVASIERYLKAAGSNPAMETLLIQSYYLQRDYANAARVQQAQIAEEIKAGKAPAESQLQLLAACQTQQKDLTGLNDTYVQLVSYYPKPEYWALILHGLMVDPKVSPALQLDVYRIRQAAGVLTAPADYMDMTELAMQAGLPQLALDLMNAGYAGGVLGKDAGAAREARLKAMVVKAVSDRKAAIAADEAAAQQAPTGNSLLTVGYNYVTFGQADKGLAIMRQGLAKGPLDPNIARLHYGLAQMAAGRNADAVATLKTVGGDNGARAIAQLWVLKLSAHH
ncbi:tetratricopeptide repeat protein [Nguyenibacter vanlangensis]|uniref:Tetratricopeptide repeat protein n=1 Tax=Nguyenibacter vanlangensis TaxID=1216886 RepID=A0ABZ3D1X2_9PROT